MRLDFQREVQRLLGRCLLRIQQYEVLLKAMLVHHELAGSVDALQAQREARSAKLADKSLGTLVKSLFDTYVVPPGFERDLLPADKTPADRIAVAFSFRLEMSPENRDKTKAAVEEFVELRNMLVHHLIEQFDLGREECCIEAARHLEESYSRIDRHFLELAGWAKAMTQVRAEAAEFANSPAFLDLLVNGIAPDGSIDWRGAGIVRVLRDAAKELAADAWTQLDAARLWISEKHPEQVPEKYGCRTWPQVLSESRQFDLEYRPEKSGRRAAWYRERAYG